MDIIPIGYKAICEQLKLNVLPHYRESYIAKSGRGKVSKVGYYETHIYPKSYSLKDESNLLENLEFALKYDGFNFEIIKALYERLNKTEITEYIRKQPTGIYSRKMWYMYEFLMKEQLNIDDCQRIKYVDLLDSKTYFTSRPFRSPRHGINDNLLGNIQYCPFVRRTEILEKYINLNLDEKVKNILNKYDPYLVARACNYLYTKETMSSYEIEWERPDKSRIARFIKLLEQAPSIESLSKDKLIELQNIIVDSRFKDFDYRQAQNYVGENLNPYFQKIHYISPKPEDVADLMQGLLDSLVKMLDSDIYPVIIAAAISFGFVFIHPFEDGNGRLHRFLIHYILSKKEFTPKDVIFPVSSVMLRNMRSYDVALESFSKPLLAILKDYSLSTEGVMTVKQESKSFYQYIDFTNLVEYLFVCIEEAIEKHIEHEIVFLVNYDRTKKSIREIVDMPDRKIDLFIQSVIQNNGKLSAQKKKRFFSLLTDDEVEQLVSLVCENMQHDFHPVDK